MARLRRKTKSRSLDEPEAATGPDGPSGMLELDFRQSLLMPALVKRFSLLRTAEGGQSVSRDDLALRLAVHRRTGLITADEERLVWQCFGEEQPPLPAAPDGALQSHATIDGADHRESGTELESDALSFAAGPTSTTPGRRSSPDGTAELASAGPAARTSAVKQSASRSDISDDEGVASQLSSPNSRTDPEATAEMQSARSSFAGSTRSDASDREARKHLQSSQINSSKLASQFDLDLLAAAQSILVDAMRGHTGGPSRRPSQASIIHPRQADSRQQPVDRAKPEVAGSIKEQHRPKHTPPGRSTSARKRVRRSQISSPALVYSSRMEQTADGFVSARPVKSVLASEPSRKRSVKRLLFGRDKPSSSTAPTTPPIGNRQDLERQPPVLELQGPIKPQDQPRSHVATEDAPNEPPAESSMAQLMKEIDQAALEAVASADASADDALDTEPSTSQTLVPLSSVGRTSSHSSSTWSDIFDAYV